MEHTENQSSSNGLYKEDRNLLRIREKERRNQEALQEKDKFPEKIPLFAEPYKTNKEDELSSRIQNMLGNYEEVKEFISNKAHQNLIGIPKSVAPLIPHRKPDRPCLPEKTSHMLPSSFHHTSCHPPMGPTVVVPPPPGHSIHYQKAQSRTEPASDLHARSHSLPNNRSQGEEHNHGGQENHTAFPHKRNDKCAVGEGRGNELQASFLALSPLLPSLSSPVAPLSPVHSSQHTNSRSQNSSKCHRPTYSQTKLSQDLVAGSLEKETGDSSAINLTINLTSTTQPSSQTFPPPLPSKTSAMQQKPTAYVRPMDGQDQAQVESPELKPLLEEYHREPCEKISDLKMNAKAKLSKLEIPSEPIEQTFPSDVHSIEEILKPDPPTSNKWQLDNWLTKVNPPAVPTESLSEIAHEDGCEEGKEEGQDVSSNFSQYAELREPHHKSSIRAARAPQDAHLPTKRSCQRSPIHTEEPLPRQTVAIKRPGKATVHKGSKGGLKVETDPDPFQVRDKSSRDKPKVKTKGKPKRSNRKDPKPALQEPPESRKHKSSHQAVAKPLLNPKLMRDVLLSGAQEHLALSPLSQGQDITPTRSSSPRTTVAAREDLHKEKLPLPGREKLLSPMRDAPSPLSLMVKIDLPLLSRIPQPPGKGSHQKRAEAKKLSSARKQDLERKTADATDKSMQKRKREVEKEIDGKKIKSEKETKSVKSSAKKDSKKLKASKASLETRKKDLLLPPPLPPMFPAPKSSKMAQKRPRSENNELPAMDNTAKNKSNHKDPLFSKHKKVERNHTELSKGIKGSAGDATNPFPVPSLPNGTSKPRRPPLKIEKQHPMEYYIEEAKRLKHKADAMTDKTGKAFQYLDAALSFIEYGFALESDAPAPKSAFSIFSDTIDLIKFIMTLKSFMDASASSHEKTFAVLCMRCQALLHVAMFRYKKDTAIKYSRLLNDHFKGSSRGTQAPSPCVARSTGMPSPLSPMPSPASSVSSQLGSNAGNSSGNSIGSSVTVPCNILNMTSSYVNITSYILYAHDIWEQADALARKNKEFFAELSTATCTLALNSSMAELVHYTRQGLQWLRLETNTP
ncbi:AF4/FMR2 family member 1 isoform X6 [Heliangelus exortis]|uniref:AF4/FMR2 family member 1 isoform X6 n=1 Tax=Heliangelus exortis TaxID=472823 RepID=UPI003A910AD8